MRRILSKQRKKETKKEGKPHVEREILVSFNYRTVLLKYQFTDKPLISVSSSSSSSLAKQPLLILPQKILPDLSIKLDHPAFTSLDFTTLIFFLQRKVVSLASKPQSGGPRSPYLCPPVAQLYPHAPGSLFVALCDSRGYGGGILTRLHKGK
jgi:hypothetical protein